MQQHSEERSPALCIIEEDINHGDPAVPDTVQSQIKFAVVTPPADIIERLRRDKEVSVTNVQPREQCDGPSVWTGLERLNSTQDPLLHLMDQLVVLPVGIGQTRACDPLGMEVVNEVAGLFPQESQHSVLSEILGLTRGEVVWMQEGNVSPAIIPTPRQTVSHLFRLFHPAPETAQESICNVACSPAPSGLITPSSGEKQLVAAFPEPTGP